MAIQLRHPSMSSVMRGAASKYALFLCGVPQAHLVVISTSAYPGTVRSQHAFAVHEELAKLHSAYADQPCSVWIIGVITSSACAERLQSCADRDRVSAAVCQDCNLRVLRWECLRGRMPRWGASQNRGKPQEGKRTAP